MNQGKVVVVGQGYVGLPLAMRAADVGYEVVGLEISPARAKMLSAGRTYVDDVPDEQLRMAIDSGRYSASPDYRAAEGFDVAVITVPTPLRDAGPDLSYVQAACESLAPYITKDSLVILESTTYPGTTETFVRPLLDAGSGLEAEREYFLGFSPERIDPGNQTWTLVNTPKVVSGLGPESLKRVATFYEALVETVVPVRSPKEAELAKLMENTFRHINIALVNELAVFAHELDIDIWSALDAAGTKPFGFMRFNPGPGVGGHCLPIDPTYLSWEIRRRMGRSFRFVEVANDVNAEMPRYVVSRMAKLLNASGKALSASTVLALGLTYKPGTADARESPSAMVVEILTANGCTVWAVDPHISKAEVPRGVSLTDLSAGALEKVDAAIILTDHSEFDLSLLAGSKIPVLDTRNAMRRFDASNIVRL